MTEPSPADDQTGRLIADFNAMAATYDTLRHAQACAHRLVDLMTLTPGAQVLDIATGTGLAAFTALQCVGPTGTVVEVDIAPEMVEYAQQKATAAGHINVTFRLGDAARLDEPAVRFDVVLCASGLFFMPDMLAALREWWRVLKPGGQVGFSGWGPIYQQPLLGLWHARLHQYGGPLPTAAPIQRLAAPTTCQQFLHEAGFVEIMVQSEQLGYYLRTPEEWWTQMWASRNRMAVLELAPAQQAQFQAEYLAEVGALATPEGIWVDVATNFARGRKPIA
jgi:ubiquinone/menaquinone biosynthesis C-methylase UbiE